MERTAGLLIAGIVGSVLLFMIIVPPWDVGLADPPVTAQERIALTLSQGDAQRACAIIATETTRALDTGDIEAYEDWRFRERETCEGFPAAVPVRK